MKQSLSLAMAALMLALTACGGGSGSTETTTAPTEATTAAPETNRLDELGTHDFGGKTFILCDGNDYPSDTMNIPRDEKTGDVINDAIYDRNSKIAELYNFTFEYLTPSSAGEAAKLLSQSYLAGDHYCDLILSTAADGSTLQSLAKQQMLTNLRDVEEISLDEAWWSGLTSDALTLNGRTYFTTGDISPSMYTRPVIIAANLDLAEDYNIGYDYYQLVVDGEWTFEKLYALTKFTQDLDNDGTLHLTHDFFGYCGDSTGRDLSAGGFVIGMGVDLSTVEDGELKVNLATEKAADVISLVNSLMPKEKMDDRRDYINKTFKENRALCIQTYLNTNLRDFESSFYYLPMPKYDAEQENYRCLQNAWGAAYAAIPADADISFVGPITEALAYESYVNVRPAIYDIVLMQKVARDEKAAELMNIVYASLYLDFNILFNFGGTVGTIADAVYNDAPFASSIAGKLASAESAIKELVEVW